MKPIVPSNNIIKLRDHKVNFEGFQDELNLLLYLGDMYKDPKVLYDNFQEVFIAIDLPKVEPLLLRELSKDSLDLIAEMKFRYFMIKIKEGEECEEEEKTT